MAELKRWPKENGIPKMDVTGYWVDEADAQVVLVVLRARVASLEAQNVALREALEKARPVVAWAANESKCSVCEPDDPYDECPCVGCSAARTLNRINILLEEKSHDQVQAI